MKVVVLLAGGRGTRLSEETETTPKPMVEIGRHPILWHIINSTPSKVIRNSLSCLATGERSSSGTLPSTQT